MVAGVTQSKSLGFENLMLPGVRKHLQEAAGALREGKEQSGDATKNSKADELSTEDQRRVEQLSAADRKVRLHEQAHLAAGGGLVRGGANYSYETGPDNKRYAVAGDVAIDASEGRTPEATITKAQQVRAAALAPADPSAQDRRVASLASQMELQARLEMAIQAAEERGRAESQQANRAIGAYQAAGGLELSFGFSATA